MSSTCVVCKSAGAHYSDGFRRMWHSTRCAHSFCDGCRTLGFSQRHTVIKCPPPCGETLTRADFSDKTPAEHEFEREKDVRRRVRAVFNKVREDFFAAGGGGGGGAAWDAYSERREALVAALVAGSAAEAREAERELDEFRRANASDINRVNARRAAEEGRRAEAAREEAAAGARRAREAAEAASTAARAQDAARLFFAKLKAGDVEGLRRQGGGGGGGGAPEGSGAAARAPPPPQQQRADLAALQARLLAIKMARASARATVAPPPTAHACPALRPPAFLGYAAEALLGKPARALPPASLPGHWRAAGVTPADVERWAQAELREMLAL
jgi:hypothetical protein